MRYGTGMEYFNFQLNFIEVFHQIQMFLTEDMQVRGHHLMASSHLLHSLTNDGKTPNAKTQVTVSTPDNLNSSGKSMQDEVADSQLAVNRSAGVAPQVILRDPITCMPFP